MAQAVLRVDFPMERMTKKMIFDLSQPVSQAREKIHEKMTAGRTLKSGTQINDYALYVPPGGDFAGHTGHQTLRAGQWLNDNDILSNYALQERGVIEYRLRPHGITVKYIGTSESSGNSSGSYISTHPVTKQTEVDFTAPIANLSLRFVTLLNLPAPSVHEQYVLYPDGASGASGLSSSSGGGGSLLVLSSGVSVAPLDPQSSLLDSGIPYNSTVILRLEHKIGKKKAAAIKGKSLLGKSLKGLNLRRGSSAGDSKEGTGVHVFGVPLKQVTVNGSVPLVDDCIAYIESRALDVEGIFRLSGSSNEIQALKKRYNNGERVNLSTVLDPHVVCGTFKLWLRELPEPLFTWVNYDPLLQVQTNPDNACKVRYLRAVIQGLPADHKRIVKQLLEFQGKIIAHEAKNKMPIHNVATVFAPNLLKSIEEGATPIIEDTSKVLGVTSVMIKNTTEIFSDMVEFYGICEAIYDFNTEKDYELSFSKGDIIFISNDDDGGWWRGEIARTGKSGMFPSNYVQVKQSFNGGGSARTEDSDSRPRGMSAAASLTASPEISVQPTREASGSVSAYSGEAESASSGKSFAQELEELRLAYDTEKAARKALLAEADALQAEIMQLRATTREIMASNAELQALAFSS